MTLLRRPRCEKFGCDKLVQVIRENCDKTGLQKIELVNKKCETCKDFKPEKEI